MTSQPFEDLLRAAEDRRKELDEAAERHFHAQWLYRTAYDKLERLRSTLEDNGLAERFEEIADQDLVELERLQTDEIIAFRAYQRAQAASRDAESRFNWF